MRKLIFGFCILAFVLASCNKDVIRGNGDTVTSARTVDNFNALNTSGSGKIFITYAPQITVTLKGYSDLLPKYVTEVKDNTLYLHYDEHTVVRNDNLEVYITMPSITALDMSGGTTINAKGNFVHVPAFKIFSSGDAGVSIDSMQADAYTISSSGNSDIATLGIVCKEADVEISGNGKATLSVSNKLNVNISGNGKVSYKGDPATVSSNISGNGSLVKL